MFVTGASTGLGQLTAATLMDQGHEVVLHARNRQRFEESGVPDRALGVVYGDLADIDQMREVAEAADTYGRFDAVIHNAGVIDGPDVAEVNVIAPYVLTALMEQPGRIVVVSSSLHRAGSTHGMEAGIAGEREVGYNDSKLWVTAFVMEVAERWPSTMVHCLCPGWVPTRMGGPHASDDLTEGHRTQEWLATAPESEIHPRTGAYWHHMAVDRPNPAALDPEFRARLFDALERRTGIEFPLGGLIGAEAGDGYRTNFTIILTTLLPT